MKASSIRIQLYRNPADYETRYIAEVEAPRLPCGGLDLRDLPNLFQLKGNFEVSCPPYSTWLNRHLLSQVIESTRYKPIFINSRNRLVPRELLNVLLRDSQYIRVICIAKPAQPEPTATVMHCD